MFVIFFTFITKSLQSYQQLWITLWIIFSERMILMAIDKEELIAKIKELLKPEVTRISYDTWILPLEIRSIDGNHIVFTANSEFQKDFIENKYKSLIFNTLRYITNKEWTFSVIDLSKEENEDENTDVITNKSNASSAEIEICSWK